MNYNEWLNEWLIIWVKPMVKDRTFEKYKNTVRLQISPQLGSCALEELTAPTLQKFTAELVTRYAPNTVTGIIAVVKSSLLCAQSAGVISRQFSDCIKTPRAQERDIGCFTCAEQKRIERYVLASKKPKLFGIVLSLYTGLRVGELIALEWSDVDLSNGTISVIKSCRDSWNKNGYVKLFDTPKTENSRRKIPIPVQLLPYLRDLKKHSANNFVVCGSGGKEISVRSYQRTFELILNGLKIPHRGFHALRHTFATRAIESGMDVKSLSKILGHKNSTVTLNRYVHTFMEHQNHMMNRLGTMFDTDTMPYAANAYDVPVYW